MSKMKRCILFRLKRWLFIYFCVVLHFHVDCLNMVIIPSLVVSIVNRTIVVITIHEYPKTCRISKTSKPKRKRARDRKLAVQSITSSPNNLASSCAFWCAQASHHPQTLS
jgi:hypothetical protein